MANVCLIGLEQTIATQLSGALAVGRHRIEQKTQNIGARDLMEVDIVFAGGDPSEYLPLLRWVRKERPALPFVIVTCIPETMAWLFRSSSAAWRWKTQTGERPGSMGKY